MKNWVIGILIVCGLIPIVIINPLGNCWNFMNAIYSLIAICIYFVFSLFFIFITKRLIKINYKIKNAILVFVIILISQIVFLFLPINEPFLKKAVYTFESPIDHHNTYLVFELKLFENNSYRLKRAGQLNHCISKGKYFIKNDLIVFDEKFIDFSLSRLSKEYYFSKDSLITTNQKDSTQFLSFETSK